MPHTMDGSHMNPITREPLWEPHFAVLRDPTTGRTRFEILWDLPAGDPSLGSLKESDAVDKEPQNQGLGHKEITPGSAGLERVMFTKMVRLNRREARSVMQGIKGELQGSHVQYYVVPKVDLPEIGEGAADSPQGHWAAENGLFGLALGSSNPFLQVEDCSGSEALSCCTAQELPRVDEEFEFASICSHQPEDEAPSWSASLYPGGFCSQEDIRLPSFFRSREKEDIPFRIMLDTGVTFSVAREWIAEYVEVRGLKHPLSMRTVSGQVIISDKVVWLDVKLPCFHQSKVCRLKVFLLKDESLRQEDAYFCANHSEMLDHLWIRQCTLCADAKADR
ncbi:uncharacterized protein Z518_03102 [Rhinocladiella mackenziei CBS 650.93]|uniref:Uncharacterized protein n=1 Tax=Rhinocladiella mackenziei CBS 650.93 TaxID=1442369 RepID=A0A0D2IYK8_9EURO|nr:uncharacterized protein Z518_03102 [Rhinocladiella mackenziei CBS 650.93]KIX08446.1 hypothetical protein Z518_03102 [Rhinocladiella mackenziei CBS 650.93]